MSRFHLSTIVSLVLMACAALFASGTPAQAAFEAGWNKAPDLGTEYPAFSGLQPVDVRITIALIVRAGIGLLGIVVLVIFLYAGFTWMTAGGNDEKITEAKGWMYGAIVGLIIIFLAFAIVTFVINVITGATLETT